MIFLVLEYLDWHHNEVRRRQWGRRTGRSTSGGWPSNRLLGGCLPKITYHDDHPPPAPPLRAVSPPLTN